MLNNVTLVLTVSLSLSLALWLSSTEDARAEGTPNFQTPATETVCDGYQVAFARLTSEEAQVCLDATRSLLVDSGACGG